MKTTIALCLVLLSAASVHAQTPTPTPAPSPSVAPGYVAPFAASTSQPLSDREARTATRLSSRLVSGERQLLTNFRSIYNDVWHNQDGLTPQQVCDALGTNAGPLFVIAGTMTNALYQIDPAGLGAMVSVPTGYAAAINTNGTVTITYPTPAPTAAPTPTSSGTP